MRPLDFTKRPAHPNAWLATCRDLIKGENYQSADVRDHKALWNSKYGGWMAVNSQGLLCIGSSNIMMVDGVWYVEILRSENVQVEISDLSFRNLP
jgi:hypothetical protein